jgi:hypothetical protein
MKKSHIFINSMKREIKEYLGFGLNGKKISDSISHQKTNI